jgi:ferredoxin-thioredoxin reductase catalytic subunit
MRLNPDKNIVKYILEQIKINGGFCPCALEKIPDSKCLCKEMRVNNICDCGLYVEEVSHEKP